MTKLSLRPARGNAALPLTPDLELRTVVVVHVETGAPTHLETRLFRRVPPAPAADPWAPTAAGFRVPLRLVPAYLEQLRSLATPSTAPTE